ncbi:polymer-forming cytoskeletal protein [Massilia arenosa]|uniref:Polymer-forming cytoskeletal protein n=1 Tax=Zemynaea arenosa TaxID=2561931 RepID=A0A4Y9S7Z6_9BURK|nr:polymer-forming cytoskeletal protein [Massilia arenosa]TFW16186.1 polymer-forming cytoskeletal protein [Massilia arenosa]
MFGRSAKNEIDSLVGPTARVRGDVVFTGGLRVDGEVLGNVLAQQGADNVLIVSEQARIVGEVRCANLVVSGVIEGPVFCTDILELQPHGRIMGDVHYHTLEMHGGATVTGKLTHEEPGEPEFHLSVASGDKPGDPQSVRQSVFRANSL